MQKEKKGTLGYKIVIACLIVAIILTHVYYQRKRAVLEDTMTYQFVHCILTIKENPGNILREGMVMDYAHTYACVDLARAVMRQYNRLHTDVNVSELDRLLDYYSSLLYNMEYEGVTDYYREYVKIYQKYFDMLDVTVENQYTLTIGGILDSFNERLGEDGSGYYEYDYKF